MALAKTRRGGGVTNYWPGYVDMLSTLLLVVTFLMSLFMLTNYFITTQTSGKDTMLSRLNRQLSELTELLALERSKKQSVEDSLSALQATLVDKDKENARLTGLLGDQSGKTEGAEAKSSEMSGQLDQQKRSPTRPLPRSRSSISSSPRSGFNLPSSRRRSMRRRPRTRRARSRSPISGSA